MPLQKTIIHPDADPTAIVNSPILKMVVLKDKDNIVQKGDELALDPPIVDRHVVWFRNPTPQLISQKFPLLPYDNNIVAFSLSTTNKIAHIIRENDTIDYALIDLSYTTAGLPQFNP